MQSKKRQNRKRKTKQHTHEKKERKVKCYGMKINNEIVTQ